MPTARSGSERKRVAALAKQALLAEAAMHRLDAFTRGLRGLEPPVPSNLEMVGILAKHEGYLQSSQSTRQCIFSAAATSTSQYERSAQNQHPLLSPQRKVYHPTRPQPQRSKGKEKEKVKFNGRPSHTTNRNYRPVTAPAVTAANITEPTNCVRQAVT